MACVSTTPDTLEREVMAAGTAWEREAWRLRLLATELDVVFDGESLLYSDVRDLMALQGRLLRHLAPGRGGRLRSLLALARSILRWHAPLRTGTPDTRNTEEQRQQFILSYHHSDRRDDWYQVVDRATGTAWGPYRYHGARHIITQARHDTAGPGA